MPVADIPEWLERHGGAGNLTVAGPAAISIPGNVRTRPLAAPDPLAIARLVEGAPEPASPPRPIYLRPPDARLPA